MRYRFSDHELDTSAFTLTRDGAPVHLEPLVFDLLCHLVTHAGEVISRDAIVEHVWKGRVVADTTVSTCIKSLRRALGDSGSRQHHVQTVRGRGFRFAATVAAVEPAPGDGVVIEPVAAGRPGDATADRPEPLAPGPKLAVLPVFPLSTDPSHALMGDALAQELILALSRLHWLSVIARGSSFKFRGQEVDLVEVGQVLGAAYVVTGTVAYHADRFVVTVELCDARENRILWADRLEAPVDEFLTLQAGMAARIAAALEPRIQHAEAMQARGLSTELLDAWSAYHAGLWHMYRFTRSENAKAQALFTHALTLDPGFARAVAGLSFTHFQNAFLGFSADIPAEMREAHALAERSVGLDPLDPFANLTMGRAEWLHGDLEAALPWMQRSTDLSPNYAFAIYNSALVGTLLGDGARAEPQVVRAIELSPIDPLNYAMLGTRALTHLVRGEPALAAQWAERAVRSPNAHVHIFAIAAICDALGGDWARAGARVKQVRGMDPRYAKKDFLAAFPVRPGEARAQIAGALAGLGF